MDKGGQARASSGLVAAVLGSGDDTRIAIGVGLQGAGAPDFGLNLSGPRGVPAPKAMKIFTILVVVLAGSAEAFAPPPRAPTHAPLDASFRAPWLHFGNTRTWLADSIRDASPGSLRAFPSSPSRGAVRAGVAAAAAPAFQLLPGPLPGAQQMTRRARAALRPAAPRHPARISLAHPARRCNTCLSRGRAPPGPLYLPLAGSAPSGRGSCWGSPTGMRSH
jgi:hypothetical protein